MPFPFEAALSGGFNVWPIDLAEWCTTNDVIEREAVGVGDEIIAIGLFTRRDGKHQNRPILRSGIIAAMPDEPLEDPNYGLEYDAYLMEIRSIGSLSGSPVFLVLPPGRVRPDGTFEMDRRLFYLLGMVRGHWNKRATELADLGGDEIEEFNTGIAIVTPIQRAVDVIMNTEELVEDRKKQARRRAEDDAPTEDSESPETGEFDRFSKLARNLIRVPKTELDEKRKGEPG